MANLAYTVPEAGTSKPSGFIPFGGNKALLLYEDARPITLFAGPDAQKVVGTPAGIKAPLTAPTATASAVPATNMLADQILTIAYAYYSSVRVVFSQMSPQVTYVVPASPSPPFQVTISGFEAPRDDYANNFIDTIVVCIQSGLNNGLQTLNPQTWIKVVAGDFAGATINFDQTAGQMEQGFNFSLFDPYCMIPPAMRYGGKLGERIWYGGQRPKVSFVDGSTVIVEIGQMFRGRLRAKVTITGDVWNDSMFWMSLYVNGSNLGDVFDRTGTTVLYLDRDLPAAISSTDDFYLTGYNDRVYPSSYTTYQPGNIPTTFPECVNILQRQLLNPALETGRTMAGIKLTRDSLNLIFQDTIVQLSGGSEPNVPAPFFNQNFGQTGTVAARSITRDADGALGFWAQEGAMLANSASLTNIGEQLQCIKFSAGGQWIGVADIPTLVMVYSRGSQGFVYGNVTIDGAANFWGLVTFKPQFGIWIFSGQEITSNIISYPGTDGQDVVLCGDGFNGRVKRLLTPGSFVDVGLATDATAAYTCSWRGGWQGKPDGQYFNNALFRFVGGVVPGEEARITLTQYRSNFLLRDLTDLPATDITTVDYDKVNFPFNEQPLATGMTRFIAMQVSHESTSGLSADGERPMEVAKWLIWERNEKGGPNSGR